MKQFIASDIDNEIEAEEEEEALNVAVHDGIDDTNHMTEAIEPIAIPPEVSEQDKPPEAAVGASPPLREVCSHPIM